MGVFKEKWLEAVDKKNSVLCAGLDPAEFSMGRGEKGLPDGRDKLAWAVGYIHAVAPYCAAVKPNINYWKGPGDAEALEVLSVLTRECGMVFIEDSKLPDIGESNDAGMFYAAKRADAVTFSPFAGNIEEGAEQAKAGGLGLISMVLMSNPDYEREKGKLVKVNHPDAYRKRDVLWLRPQFDDHAVSYVPQYIQLAHDAGKFGLDGVVIGAPSVGNHIQDEEIARVRHYVGGDMRILLPGVGAQGGEAGAIWKYFSANNVIVNVGRALMFPKGSASTPEDHIEAARHYRDMLNSLRGAA